MRQPIATFCSLALCLWGYQTGLWILAIPMVVALEGREFLRRRWQTSWEMLQILYVLAGILWLFTIVCFPPTSPSPLAYAARYQILRGLPVALFPLILAQTYCLNVSEIYQSLLGRRSRKNSQFSLYYPYFGICLLAASATGGNNYVFLAAALLLVTGVLWVTRSPRFSSMMFYSLILVSLVLSLAGAHQFYWMQANVKLPRFSDLVGHIAVSWPKSLTSERFPLPQGFEEKLGDALEFETSNPSDLADFTSGSLTSDGDETHSERDTHDPATLNPTDEPSPSSGDEEDISSGDETQFSSASESERDESRQRPEDSNPIALKNEEAIPQQEPSSSGDTESTNTKDSGSSASSPTPSAPPTAGASSTNASLPSGIQAVGGLIDPQTSQTRIGSLGSLPQSNAILFRVTPLNGGKTSMPYPIRIREATYNQYRSGAWHAADSTFTPQNKEGNQQWVLNSSHSPLSVRISEVLQPTEGLLKLPIGSSRIKKLDVDSIAKNQFGAVSFKRQAGPPLEYDVQFDPGNLRDSAPTRIDRTVPPQERPALRQVLDTLDVSGKSESQVVQAISSFFRKDFQYSLDLAPSANDQTPMASFLLDHHTGHCEYFASATSLLLREAGIPTRYVVGYLAQDYNADEQHYVVRLKNAHAWVMAYVEGRWQTIDTTPEGDGFPNSGGQETVVEQIAQRGVRLPEQNSQTDRTGQTSNRSNDQRMQGGLQQSEDSTVPQPAAPAAFKTLTNAWSSWTEMLRQKLSDLWADLKSLWSRHPNALWFGSFMILGVAIAFGTALLIWKMCRPKERHRRRRDKSPRQQDMVYTFKQIEACLENLDLHRNPSETPKHWVIRLEKALPESQFQGLKAILDLHYRDRFDPAGLNESDRQRLATLIETWLVNFGQRRVRSSSELTFHG